MTDSTEGPTIDIAETDDGRFAAAVNGFWLPGWYPTRASALAAARSSTRYLGTATPPAPRYQAMRHLVPRFEWGGWCGSALTYDPNGGIELPPGLTRSMAQAFGNPTTIRERDEVEGRILCVQWFGLMVEIGVGRVR